MKTCSVCKEKKGLDNFRKKSSSKDGLNGVCKSCKSMRHKVYRVKNNWFKETILKNKTKRRNIRRKLICDIKISAWCVDCGYNLNAAALQFDHLGDKNADISVMVSDMRPLTKILEEIEKCEVRCANCHAIKTSKQFWRYDHTVDVV